MNSLIGKLGMDFLKPVSKLSNKGQHNLISTTIILRNSVEIDYDLYMDSWKPSINIEVCESFGFC